MLHTLLESIHNQYAVEKSTKTSKIIVYCTSKVSVNDVSSANEGMSYTKSKCIFVGAGIQSNQHACYSVRSEISFSTMLVPAAIRNSGNI